MKKTLEYKLGKKLDAYNFERTEDELLEKIDKEGYDSVIFDASETEYISSAGLRVVLRLLEKLHDVSIKNVCAEVYDILDMTGFTRLLPVERLYKEVNIDGCKVIGEGTHGIVYRLTSDTIVKVYRPFVTFEHIKKERDLAKKAFMLGLPTAMTLDIVKVGEQYGIIFELLDACSCSEYLNQKEENTDIFISKLVDVLKYIHSIEINDGSIPNMKEEYKGYAAYLKPYLDEKEFKKLVKIVNSVPDCNTLLHADLHLKNMLMRNDELMLIDMDKICVGDPIFDIATLSNSFYEFGLIDPKAITEFLGISVDKSQYIFKEICRRYLDSLNELELDKYLKKARLLGCVRAMQFFLKRKANEKATNYCINDIKTLLKNI